MSDIPRIVIGAQKLVMYDFLATKPTHRRMAWAEGIWSNVDDQFHACSKRHCLLLLAVDPVTKRQTYQHGDPGPSLEVDPARAGFAQVKEWLQRVHQQEDRLIQARREAAAAAEAAGPSSQDDPGAGGLFSKLFGRRK